MPIIGPSTIVLHGIQFLHSLGFRSIGHPVILANTITERSSQLFKHGRCLRLVTLRNCMLSIRMAQRGGQTAALVCGSVVNILEESFRTFIGINIQFL